MVFDKRLAHKNEEVMKGGLRKMYENLVTEKIRARYSQNDVEAIVRKALAGIDMSEFIEYNAFAEQCKAEARMEIGLD
jgi:hypothetical protein